MGGELRQLETLASVSFMPTVHDVVRSITRCSGASIKLRA